MEEYLCSVRRQPSLIPRSVKDQLFWATALTANLIKTLTTRTYMIAATADQKMIAARVPIHEEVALSMMCDLLHLRTINRHDKDLPSASPLADKGD